MKGSAYYAICPSCKQLLFEGTKSNVRIVCPRCKTKWTVRLTDSGVVVDESQDYMLVAETAAEYKA